MKKKQCGNNYGEIVPSVISGLISEFRSVMKRDKVTEIWSVGEFWLLVASA